MVSPAPSPDATLLAGTLLGAFEVLSCLGRGGMGAVYKVRNRVTGDERALKIMLPELGANPTFVERFLREIRLAMAVEHPNLVRVFEPGMDGTQVFLPMELLVGETLAARLEREHRLPIAEAIDLVCAIGAALSTLHAREILHRDVKPSNIFLAREGDTVIPKLLDLGAGKQVGMSDEATSTGHAIGSPHYMAPEQASGRRDLDARVDEYALGVVAYEALTGARPFENDETGHVLAKMLSGASFRRPRELRPEIPDAVEATVLQAMSRARERRFPTVEAFTKTLSDPSSEVRSSSAEPTRPLPRQSSPPPASRPNPAPHAYDGDVRPAEASRSLLWFGMIAAVLLLVAGAIHKVVHPSTDASAAPSASHASTATAKPPKSHPATSFTRPVGQTSQGGGRGAASTRSLAPLPPLPSERPTEPASTASSAAATSPGPEPLKPAPPPPEQ